MIGKESVVTPSRILLEWFRFLGNSVGRRIAGNNNIIKYV
jgi:hypothetical protein